MSDEHGLPDLPPEEMIPYILEQQREDFRKKFGRDPGPGDPIFFDPDADEPRPIDREKLERDMIEVMTRAGVDPALMYAANKTGLIVTEMNQHLLSDKDLAEWEEAIEEYHELEGRLGVGEDPAESSEMPAPPFPQPHDGVLEMICNSALDDYKELGGGEEAAKAAILQAAVHAWMEGHIEGEDLCPGCTFRGDADLREKIRGKEFPPEPGA